MVRFSFLYGTAASRKMEFLFLFKVIFPKPSYIYIASPAFSPVSTSWGTQDKPSE